MVNDKSNNLFVGRIIEDSTVSVEVLSFDNDNMFVKALKVNNVYFERYLQVGKKYRVFKHPGWDFDEGIQVWEVDPKDMTRNSSQMILQWEDEIGWIWDLDS